MHCTRSWRPYLYWLGLGQLGARVSRAKYFEVIVNRGLTSRRGGRILGYMSTGHLAVSDGGTEQYHVGYYRNRYAGWHHVEHFDSAVGLVRWLIRHANDIWQVQYGP
jgi:hypothetical protein